MRCISKRRTSKRSLDFSSRLNNFSAKSENTQYLIHCTVNNNNNMRAERVERERNVERRDNCLVGHAEGAALKSGSGSAISSCDFSGGIYILIKVAQDGQ